MKELIDKIIKEFNDYVKTPQVLITPIQGEASVFESCFGGTPYLPPNFTYPCSEINKQPLRFLAQINFSEVPCYLEGFPKEGILQFYIACKDYEDFYGADFENPTIQNSFRVVYHDNILTDESQLQKVPLLADEINKNSPVKCARKLVFSKAIGYMGDGDYRFLQLFSEICNRFSEGEFKSYFDLVEVEVELEVEDDDGYEICIDEYLSDKLNIGESKLGGYATLCQGDPREKNEYFKNYNILLLQICSKDKIYWGDFGAAQFFISSEDLINCKFNNIFYTWAC